MKIPDTLDKLIMNSLEAIGRFTTRRAIKNGDIDSLFLFLNQSERHEMLEKLLKKRGYAKHTNSSRLNLLHLCVEYNDISSFKLCLAAGVDINAKDRKNWTCAHHAIALSNYSMLREICTAPSFIPAQHPGLFIGAVTRGEVGALDIIYPYIPDHEIVPPSDDMDYSTQTFNALLDKCRELKQRRADERTQAAADKLTRAINTAHTGTTRDLTVRRLKLKKTAGFSKKM